MTQDGRRKAQIVYLLALIAAISTWFVAARAPLYMDEAGSYWEIAGGFHAIWARQFIIFPTYNYLLWAWTKLFGISEFALRSLSLVAMFIAAGLFYKAARVFLDRETSLLALVLFCLHPIVVAEATEVRPYACALVLTNLSILLLFRLCRGNSLRLAALFGVASALIVYFHQLFAVILPSFILCFFLLKTPHTSDDRKTLWRQFWTALLAFALTFVPLIPGIRYLFHTAKTHTNMPVPKFHELFWTLAPGFMPPLLIGTGLIALIAAAVKPWPATHPEYPSAPSGMRLFLALAALGLVPVLILYVISIATPIEIFIFRHRLEAIPGIALCWAWLLGKLRPALLRPVFCVLLAAITAIGFFTTPMFRLHISSEKAALALVQKEAAPTHAPVVICSTFVESNFNPMPKGDPADSFYFAQLSYYKLTVPVIPLPTTLNAQAMQIGSRFLQKATKNRQPFFAIGFVTSFRTLDWLTDQAASAYTVRDLGIFYHYKVLKFTPRPAPEPSLNPVKPPHGLTH